MMPDGGDIMITSFKIRLNMAIASAAQAIINCSTHADKT
jgi:hypothetical protein